MAIVSTHWSSGGYDQNFKRTFLAGPPLFEEITNKINLMDDIGIHVVNTFNTSDPGLLNKQFEEHGKMRNQFKIVGLKEQNKPDGARSTLYNLTNLFDKKVIQKVMHKSYN
jgi:hypothetical protein